MATVGSGTTSNQANLPLLHRFLGIGMVALVTSMVIVRHVLMGDSGDEGVSVVSYGVSGASAALLGGALMILRARVPRRRPPQTRQAFWADANTARSAMLFWCILEGSAVLASVAYFLNANPVAAVLIVAAVVAFWMNGPGVFDQE